MNNKYISYQVLPPMAPTALAWAANWDMKRGSIIICPIPDAAAATWAACAAAVAAAVGGRTNGGFAPNPDG